MDNLECTGIVESQKDNNFTSVDFQMKDEKGREYAVTFRFRNIYAGHIEKAFRRLIPIRIKNGG